MAQWVIDSNPTETDRKNREKHGDTGFEDRRAVAKAKGDEFPESQWEQACFYGGQFENLAMAASDKVWAGLREKPHTFWVKLFQKLAA